MKSAVNAIVRDCMRALRAVTLMAVVAAGHVLAQEQYLPEGTLRVCQDPNNLPFSNTRGEGFENKIADLLATRLGWQVAYTSFPQRMGFVRNTLRSRQQDGAYRCDVIMGVPAGYDQASPTRPYFRSTYALVVADSGATRGVSTEEDFLSLPSETLGRLRIGVYTRSPGALWLARHGLGERAVPYRSLNADPDQYPGEIIERDLTAGRIDGAIVWGPIAGFYAKQVRQPTLRVIPLRSLPGLRLDFAIALGVRHEDRAWKLRLQNLIDANQTEILSILREFGVPLLDQDGDTPQ